MLGNGRLEAMCIDGQKRLCHIRGKMRKKVWVNTVSSSYPLRAAPSLCRSCTHHLPMKCQGSSCHRAAESLQTSLLALSCAKVMLWSSVSSIDPGAMKPSAKPLPQLRMCRPPHPLHQAEHGLQHLSDASAGSVQPPFARDQHSAPAKAVLVHRAQVVGSSGSLPKATQAPSLELDLPCRATSSWWGCGITRTRRQMSFSSEHPPVSTALCSFSIGQHC